jgi:hypothetical protein
MSPIENHVDWTAPATGRERVATSLSRPTKPPEPARPGRTTLDKLLGDSNLTAYDSSGNDPYNATGRQFRR